MISTRDIDTVQSGNVIDSDGDKVGSVGEVYLDNKSGEPEWVTVKTGMFGGKASFVPLAQATVQGEDLHVPYEKSKIKDAPKIDDDAELTPAEEDELYAYYGVQGSADRADVDVAPVGGVDTRTDRTDTDRTDRTDTEGHDTSGPNTDDAITRSEERLNVGTRTEETGRARLRKYIVTEQQSVTVPVSHEEVTLEREPITEANRGQAVSGGDLSEEEHEVTLHAERAVVDKETVPVERIKVGTETVTGEETVTDSVRKEQVELDDDAGTEGRQSQS